MTRRPVFSVIVLRALDLGDMLCAVPAFRALRQACPVASLTLCGLPWARDFAARYWAIFDDFIEFPGYPGLPERACEPDDVSSFLDSVRSRGFDLAVQLHGDGRVTNGLVGQFGAVGVLLPPPQPWPGTVVHEVERCLLPFAAAGLPRAGLELELPIGSEEQASALRLLTAHGVRPPYAVLHPGAKWESRRWPAMNFASVARRLGDAGVDVVVTGVESERSLGETVSREAGRRIVNLCGETSPGTFFALIAGASVGVTNDTGTSHVAAATRTPSVVVASGSDIDRWRPLDSNGIP